MTNLIVGYKDRAHDGVVLDTSRSGFDRGVTCYASIFVHEDDPKNLAVRKALFFIKDDTKWLIIIDGDYTYPAKYLPLMRRILERHKYVGVVSGKQGGYIFNARA